MLSHQFGSDFSGGKELWEISNEKTESCDLPLTLDITLLGIKVKQDEIFGTLVDQPCFLTARGSWDGLVRRS
jgi:hypothetical protein